MRKRSQCRLRLGKALNGDLQVQSLGGRRVDRGEKVLARELRFVSLFCRVTITRMDVTLDGGGGNNVMPHIPSLNHRVNNPHLT